jgi:hypothetical protein
MNKRYDKFQSRTRGEIASSFLAPTPRVRAFCSTRNVREGGRRRGSSQSCRDGKGRGELHVGCKESGFDADDRSKGGREEERFVGVEIDDLFQQCQCLWLYVLSWISRRASEKDFVKPFVGKKA